jgi:hypothetical protein
VAEVGIATVYVIHSWSSSFADTVSALESTSTLGEYFFIDVLCESYKVLTGSRRVSVNYLTGAFEQRIAKVGRSLLVLAPWERPAVLERAWPMFEILLSSTTDAELLVATPVFDKPAFELALLNDFASIAAKIARLSLDEASSTDRRQREAIIDVLMRSHGSTRPGNTRIASTVRYALAEHAALVAGTEEGRRLLALSKAQADAEEKEAVAGRGLGSGALGFVTRWLGAPVGLVDVEVVARTSVCIRILAYINYKYINVGGLWLVV